MDWSDETIDHFQNHIEPILPAKGEEILDACNQLEDVPFEDKEIIKKKINPETNYQDIDAIMTDLNA